MCVNECCILESSLPFSGVDWGPQTGLCQARSAAHLSHRTCPNIVYVRADGLAGPSAGHTAWTGPLGAWGSVLYVQSSARGVPGDCDDDTVRSVLPGSNRRQHAVPTMAHAFDHLSSCPSRVPRCPPCREEHDATWRQHLEALDLLVHAAGLQLAPVLNTGLSKYESLGSRHGQVHGPFVELAGMPGVAVAEEGIPAAVRELAKAFRVSLIGLPSPRAGPCVEACTCTAAWKPTALPLCACVGACMHKQRSGPHAEAFAP